MPNYVISELNIGSLYWSSQHQFQHPIKREAGYSNEPTVSRLWVDPISCNCVQALVPPPPTFIFFARDMVVFKFLLHILKNSHSFVGFTFSNRLQQPRLKLKICKKYFVNSCSIRLLKTLTLLCKGVDHPVI